MLVTLNSVNVEKTHKYSFANVVFSRDGKDEVRKIMSFGGSAKAFNKLVELKEFPKEVNVTMEKNAKGFWEWKDVETSTGVAAVAKPGVNNGGKVLGSNYETPSERARRQVYIIRQSSISSAIEYLSSQAKAKYSVEEILEVAKTFENYVMDIGVIPGTNEVIE
jgi:hypothetical protein